MDEKGHPLPQSGEARHDEIPDRLVREKGKGDDARAVVQPEGDPVAPDGERYRDDALAEDQAAHQDRGQGVARSEAEGG